MALRGSEAKFDQFAKVISGIQGMTIRLAVDQKARGTLRVDFSDSPQVFGALAKPVLLEALDRHGAHLADLDNWAAKIQGNSIVMDGEFSTDGLRRLFSLLEIPTTKFSTLKNEDTSQSQSQSQNSPSDKIKASQVYFKTVTALITDLRKTLDDNRDNHSVWMERYGRKIDALPLLHVDDDLLAYGANVGQTFREMALAHRSAFISGGVRKSGIYGSYQYGYDSAGYYNTRSTESVRNQVTAEENAAPNSRGVFH